jgi:long-subunit acyl-CoA synthetase (AMP-forming)
MGPYPVSHSPRRPDDDERITPTSGSTGTPQSVQLKPVDLSKL